MNIRTSVLGEIIRAIIFTIIFPMICKLICIDISLSVWIVLGVCMGLIELAVRSDFLYKHKIYKGISWITIFNIGIIILTIVMINWIGYFKTMSILLQFYILQVAIRVKQDIINK